jgi:hypothetical protein
VAEPASEAIARTPEEATWLAVLIDGRITGVVTRAALAKELRTTEDRPEHQDPRSVGGR